LSYGITSSTLLHINACHPVSIIAIKIIHAYTIYVRTVHRRLQCVLHVARTTSRVANSHTACRGRTLVNTVLETRLLARATRHITAVEVEVASRVEVLAVGLVHAAIIAGAGNSSSACG
jgi:hypothetical protein